MLLAAAHNSTRPRESPGPRRGRGVKSGSFELLLRRTSSLPRAYESACACVFAVRVGRPLPVICCLSMLVLLLNLFALLPVAFAFAFVGAFCRVCSVQPWAFGRASFAACRRFNKKIRMKLYLYKLYSRKKKKSVGRTAGVLLVAYNNKEKLSAKRSASQKIKQVQ